MALRPNQIRMVAGDTLPKLRGTLTEDDGTPVGLTGASVQMHIKYASPLVKTATIEDADNGVWVVEWGPTDLVEGSWTYEIQVTFSDGSVRTFNRETTTDRALSLLIDGEIS